SNSFALTAGPPIFRFVRVRWVRTRAGRRRTPRSALAANCPLCLWYVLVRVPLAVDHGGNASCLVSDNVGSTSQTRELELLEDHVAPPGFRNSASSEGYGKSAPGGESGDGLGATDLSLDTDPRGEFDGIVRGSVTVRIRHSARTTRVDRTFPLPPSLRSSQFCLL